jgi:hypothetical protein
MKMGWRLREVGEAYSRRLRAKKNRTISNRDCPGKPLVYC